MKKILNIGCGNDTYGTHFADLYPARPEVKKLNVENASWPFPKKFFDEVYAKSVFEHLKNPGEFIRKCKSLLKDNGKLIIITDNAAHYRFHIKFFPKADKTHYGAYELLGRVGGGTGNNGGDRHYALFTPNHLKNYMEDEGLKIESITYEKNSSVTPLNKIIDFLVSLVDERLVCPLIKVVAIKSS